jgi:RNA polymerase sigma factor (sigma-70 family)
MAGVDLKAKKDAELVILVRTGNLEAFGCLVERYQSQMKSLAIRMLDHEDIALEMVQEALLQAFLSIQNLNEPQRFKSWLYGIVVNLCRNYLRKEQGKDLQNIEFSEDLQYNHAGSRLNDPEILIEKLDDHKQFISLIERLKPIYRQVILLHYFYHLRLAEIGEWEGVSLETVKVRLHRARSMLRDQLRELNPEISQEILPEDRRKTMLLVKVVDVIKLDNDEGCIVLLINEPGDKILPIWIGTFEGLSIAVGIESLESPRPLTYRWVASILDILEAELEEVRIEGLKEDTFLGTMVIRKGDRLVELDARPSDLIALAVHKGIPIYAGEELMLKAGIDLGTVKGKLQPLKGVQEMVMEFSEVNRKLQQKRSGEGEWQEKRAQLINRIFGSQEN